MTTARLAVLSAGAWSSVAHLPAIAESADAELVAVSSPDAELARRLAEQFGAANVFTDHREALALGLDGVVVNSPPAFHVGMVTDALQAGCHVLVEKPFATCGADADAMVSAAAASPDRALLCGFGWIHMPIFAQARAALGAGAIGAVEHITISLTVNTRSLLHERQVQAFGPGGVAPSPETYADPEVSGGGAAAVSMCHQFAVLLTLAQAAPSSVFADMVVDSAQLDLHDAVVVRFDSGAIASLGCVSTASSTPPVSWHVEVTGSAGELRIDTAARSWRVVDTTGGFVERPSFDDDAFDYDPFGPTRALIAVCRGSRDGAGENSVELARRTVELMTAAYQSARTGARVSV